ncbi:hypothetical protein ACLMJK_009574 [Lecanora helva]
MSQCVACEKPLTVFIEHDDDDDEDRDMGNSSAGTGYDVDDDVQLQCGCHFHWECLLEAYSVNDCPHCGKNAMTMSSSGKQNLLCNIKNEGGQQQGVNILPMVTEEAYLRAYPEERRCQAFLDFCGQGDIEVLVGVFQVDEEDDDKIDEEDGDDDMQRAEHVAGLDILRYQNHAAGSLSTGLHIAVRENRFEVAWLLLLLASTLTVSQFPSPVLQAAQGFNLQRDDQSGKIDIRSLKDSDGKTPEQRAIEMGGDWVEWVQSGRLRPPDP